MAIISGSIGADIIIPTGGNDYRGGGGSDTYILTSLMAAGTTAQITDTEGTNVIQLNDGLTIASSSFTNNAVELTLSNGAKVQVLGANNMTFQVGANATASPPDTATSQTYAQFATALGTTVPAAGAPATTGTPNFVVPSTSAGATVSFASSTVSLVEGNTGTTNMVFTVTLSAAQTTAVTVNYATANGTATAGSDFTTTAGTLTFAVGETSKTINVPITGDAVFEPNETFTMTLSGVSGGTSVTLGTATATATITNDDANQSPVLSRVSGPLGTPVPAQVGNITAQGLIGNFTASDPDTTVLTATISALNGLVRINDPTNLLSYGNGYVQGTNTATIVATGSAANLSTLLDTLQYTPSGAAGSSDTITVALSDGNTTVNQTVTADVGGQFGPLAAGAQNLVGTAFADLFFGTGATATEVVEATDTIAGGLGNDTLRFTAIGTNNIVLVPALTAPATITSIENVEAITSGAAAYLVNLDASRVGGLQTISFNALNVGDDLTATNLTNDMKVNLFTSNPVTNPTLAVDDITIQHAQDGATPGTQSLDVTLANTSGGLTVDLLLVGGLGGTAIDQVTLTSNGSTGNTITTLDSWNVTDLILKGGANLTIPTLSADNYTNINATGLTGNLVLGSTANNGAIGQAITLGSGNDSVLGTAQADLIVGNDGADTIDGAAGDDVIQGGAGNDRLTPGTGVDTMTGGLGADRFDYRTIVNGVLSATAVETITDFVSGTDTLRVTTTPVSIAPTPGVDLLTTTIASTGTTIATLTANLTTAVAAFGTNGQQAGDIMLITVTGTSIGGADQRYMVIESGATAGFTAAQDTAVLLTGVTTLALTDFVT